MMTHEYLITVLASISLALFSGQSRAADVPAVEIKRGEQLTRMPGASGTPCHGGYLLSRRFSVGDEATIRVSDRFSKVQTEVLSLRVTKVDVDAQRVELNNGEWVMNPMGNVIKSPDSAPRETPRHIAPAELRIGTQWSAKWVDQGPRGFAPVRLELKVAAFEKVSVPAGEFDAFRIEGHGWLGQGLPFLRRYWIVPGLNFAVRYEHVLEGPSGQGRTIYLEADDYELVSLRQQVADVKCLASSPPERFANPLPIPGLTWKIPA